MKLDGDVVVESSDEKQSIQEIRPAGFASRLPSYGEKLCDQLRVWFGGAEGTRTPDPLHAKQVLSQLSYSPTNRWL